ncbi:MAG TPA: hypothetical protein VFB61_01640 [Gemmatimonadales bacterium]|nr:hypothetical protein [Gemmatimonadales bacterium]
MRNPQRPQIRSPESRALQARTGPLILAAFDRNRSWFAWYRSQLM